MVDDRPYHRKTVKVWAPVCGPTGKCGWVLHREVFPGAIFLPTIMLNLKKKPWPSKRQHSKGIQETKNGLADCITPPCSGCCCCCCCCWWWWWWWWWVVARSCCYLLFVACAWRFPLLPEPSTITTSGSTQLPVPSLASRKSRGRPVNSRNHIYNINTLQETNIQYPSFGKGTSSMPLARDMSVSRRVHDVVVQLFLNN